MGISVRHRPARPRGSGRPLGRAATPLADRARGWTLRAPRGRRRPRGRGALAASGGHPRLGAEPHRHTTAAHTGARGRARAGAGSLAAGRRDCRVGAGSMESRALVAVAAASAGGRDGLRRPRLESWLQHSRLWGTAAARRTPTSPESANDRDPVATHVGVTWLERQGRRTVLPPDSVMVRWMRAAIAKESPE